MRRACLFIIFLPALMAAGCGTSNHLNRDRGIFEFARNADAAGLRSYEPAGDIFTGQLNLLYEKKIKGSADSPIITGNNLLAFKSTRNRFLAFEQHTGKKVCQIKKRRGIILQPAITDSLLVLVKKSKLGQIEVINLLNGNVIGKRVIKEIRSGPIIVSNSLIIGTVGGLLSLTLPDLETRWWCGPKEMIDFTPVSDSKTIYFAAANGLIKAVAADNGETRWEKRLDAPLVSELSLGNHLYFGVADGRMMALDIQSGDPVWEQSLGDEIRSGVAEYDGRIYTGCTDGNIYCLSVSGGEKIWQFPTEGVVTAAPIVYGQTVLVGSHDRHFYSIDRGNGRLIDRRRLEGPIVNAAAVDNDLIFVTCRSRRLYCFEGYR